MHPLFGADVGTLLRLLRRDGPVSPTHLPNLALAFLSAIGRAPFRFGERAHMAWRRRRHPDMPPPVFIVGHWRSGTTHLYNILSKGDFGYVSPFAAGMPHEYQTLGRWLRPWLTAMLPKTRYVDQVAVAPDAPQEDEIPLGSMSPISFYHGVYFPRYFEYHMNRSLFLDDCSPEDIEAWEVAFCRFMEKLWLDQRRRLLIKNPVYSARMPQLQKLFPEARFIHIYRNPHAVVRSTRRFYKALIERFAWQSVSDLDVDRLVLESYRRVMDRVEADRQCLPAGHFVDLRYEDLETQPLQEVERLFRELDLGDVRPWLATFERYLTSVEGYRKTNIPEGLDDQLLVERHCGDVFDRLGYGTLSPR